MIAIPARALREIVPWPTAIPERSTTSWSTSSRTQPLAVRDVALAGRRRPGARHGGRDVKQAIYRWRDARIENILEFPAPRHELVRNYRSTQPILDLAHGLVDGAPGLDGFTPRLEAHREGTGIVPVLYHPRESVDRREDEARAVAAWIEHLLGRARAPAAWGLPPVDAPLAPGSIAVLVRSSRAGGPPRARGGIHAPRPPLCHCGRREHHGSGCARCVVRVSFLAPARRLHVHLLAVLECRPCR